MKSINRKESKKIAVMATIIVGLMMIAFMPFASANVTSFSVTPSSGVAGLVDSYDALVTTDGVTTIEITIPAGFIAVAPATGGVQIARVDFWNSTKAYYGYATITSNKTDPAAHVDIYWNLGGVVATQYNVGMDYTPGAITTFGSGIPGDTSSATITLPEETKPGSIEIDIATTTAFQLEDVHIAIGEFVRNPLAPCVYVFEADGERAEVSITVPIGRGAVFRDGLWYADTDGDHQTDIWHQYGIAGDKPAVGDINNNGVNNLIAYRNGRWYVSMEDHSGTNWLQTFWYGIPSDIPVLGDIDSDGTVDTIIYRVNTGEWWVKGKGVVFTYGGSPNDIPLVADYNNNGTNEVIIYRANTGEWWVRGVANPVFKYGGIAGDKPIVDDIRNDGSNDIAILRDGCWFVLRSDHAATDYRFNYGITGDVPILNKFV